MNIKSVKLCGGSDHAKCDRPHSQSQGKPTIKVLHAWVHGLMNAHYTFTSFCIQVNNNKTKILTASYNNELMSRIILTSKSKTQEGIIKADQAKQENKG